eukprot:3140699-Pyramimonas_sp.AAC.1
MQLEAEVGYPCVLCAWCAAPHSRAHRYNALSSVYAYHTRVRAVTHVEEKSGTCRFVVMPTFN